MTNTLRRSWRCLKEGAPGSRFREVHEQRQEMQRGRSAARRAVPIVLGVILLLGGIAIGWVPGPGGFIGIFGLALLATQFRWLAKLLDWTELRFRAVWRHVWKRRSAPVRVLVVLIATTVAAGAAYALKTLLLE